jgi:large subunit ribosomal protein L13
MSTTLAKPAEMVDRKWYVIDAAGKPLGRVAAQACCVVRTRLPLPPMLTAVTMSS